jgi:hypothetical protein
MSQVPFSRQSPEATRIFLPQQATTCLYSTFVVYKDGQKATSVTLQGDVESFITLDFTYRYLGAQ